MRLLAIAFHCLLASAVLPASAEPMSRTLKVGVRHNMEATLYTPAGPGPHPSVIVIHTSQGLTEADRQYCARLAREGFRCIVPAFLRAHGIAQETKMMAFTTERDAILADFREIVDELGRLPGAKPGAVGAVGFSNGGLFSVLLAAQGQVKAGVAYYGALVGVLQPRPGNPFLQSFTSASAPVLLLAGENDTTMGTKPVRALEGIIKSAGAPCQLIFYADAEHGFDRNNLRPGNHAAGIDAWTRTLAFLRANLR
ncbi:MAG: dienelactone hydrolase family protein [Alphaproteobacteria bacterium]|nr:MAG: dienelactone hydrolase family protein [Alphaproteobacteria bacterium]